MTGVLGRIWRLGRVSKGFAVLTRIGWLGRVCIVLRQEGLVKSIVGALPYPFDGHDGKAGLAKRCVHRFCRGDTGRALKF